MRKSTLFSVLAALGILFCLCLAGVFLLWGMKSSTSGTMRSGRSVTATADAAWMEVAYGEDTATIRAAGAHIVVAPDAVYLNERLWGHLPVEAKNVEVTLERARLSVVADGNVVEEISAAAEP
jgi:hypothetical protein